MEQMDKRGITGIIELTDNYIASTLETDVETYCDIIERCTYWEGMFIVMATFSDNPDKLEKAKRIFNSYIK